MTYNDVPYVLVDFFCTLIDFLCALVDFHGFLVDFLGGAAHSLCSLVDFLRGSADFLCGLVDSLGLLVDFFRGLADLLCSLVNLLRTPINPPGSLVDALLYRCLPNTLDRSLDGVSDTYFIVCDGISQILDEAIQGADMIGILQELQQSVFFG